MFLSRNPSSLVRSFLAPCALAALLFGATAPATAQGSIKLPNTDRGGNSIDLATFWNTITVFGKAVIDEIGRFDRNDWYQFTVPAYNGANYTTRGVLITVTGLTQSATAELWERHGSNVARVATRSCGLGQNAVFSTVLQIRDALGYPVIYYVHLTTATAVSTPYALNISPQ